MPEKEESVRTTRQHKHAGDAILDNRIVEPQTPPSHMLDVCRLIRENLEGMNLETVSSQCGSVNLETVGEPLYVITMLSSLGTIQLCTENSRQ